MTATATSRFVVPFADLLDALRRQGFTIGLDHYLRIYALLERVGDECSPEQLKTLLCPLIATNGEQQEQFYRIFDQQFGMLADGASSSIVDDGDALPITGGSSTDTRTSVRADAPARAKQAPRARNARWRAVLILALIPGIALLARIPWRNSPQDSAPVDVESPASPAIADSAPAGTQTAIAPAPTTTLPSTEVPAVATPGAVQEREAPAVPRPRTPFGLPLVTLVVPLIVLLVLLGWRLNEWFSERRRRLALRRERTGRPPFSWPVRIPLARQPYAGSSEVAETARVVRAREASEAQELAINETIAATIAARGMPTLRYRRGTRSPDYLMLIERTTATDHHAQLFADLASSLAREGVYITTYLHDGDPRVCFSETDETATLLGALRHRFPSHRLVLFGTGERLVDPVSMRLHPWVESLMDWRDRVLLTPQPIAEWGIREHTLSKYFVVLPASVDGLRTAGEIMLSPDHSAGTRTWHGDQNPLQLPVTASDAVEGLRATLPVGVFEWLCACALYPELHWELTLYIGALPCLKEGLVIESNLLQLIRLPWFRRGAIPDEIRLALIKALPLEVAQAVRTALVQLLEQHAPPSDSAAAPRYELNLAMQRLLSGARDVRKQRVVARDLERFSERELLQDRVYLRLLAPHARGPLALLLPQALRKSLRGVGAPGFSGNGVRVAGAIAAACLLLFAFAMSWSGNRMLARRVADAERAVEALPVPPSKTGSISQTSIEALRQLEALRAQLDTLGSYVDSGPPFRLRFGFWRGEALFAEARQVWSLGYRRQLYYSSYGALTDSLHALPESPRATDDYGTVYSMLKAYLLMTDESSRSTASFLAPVLLTSWARGQTLDADVIATARSQFEFYSTLLARENPYPQSADARVVRHTRAFLNRFAGDEQIYQNLLVKANNAVARARVLAIAPMAPGIIGGPSEVAGAYTVDGWAYMQAAITNDDFTGEPWVVGDSVAAQTKDLDAVLMKLRRRYYNDYVERWRTFVKSVTVIRPSGSGLAGALDAARKVGAVASAQSPLLAVLAMVAHNTNNDSSMAAAFQPVHTVELPGAAGTYVNDKNQAYVSGLVAVQGALEAITFLPEPRDSAGTLAFTAKAQESLAQVTLAKGAARQLAQKFSVDTAAVQLNAAVSALLEAPINGAETVLRGIANTRSAAARAATVDGIRSPPTTPFADKAGASASSTTRAQNIETFRVAPSEFRLEPGGTGQLLVELRNGSGVSLRPDRGSVQFSSSDRSIVAVSGSGAVRAVSEGRAEAVARVGGQIRRVSVVVAYAARARSKSEPTTQAEAKAERTTEAARPVAISDLLDFIAAGMPTPVMLDHTRRNCLATAVSAADETKLFAAGVNSAFVAQLKNSCVAAAVVYAAAAAVPDAKGAVLASSVQAQQLNCARGSYAACDTVADAYLEGIFAPRSPTKAAEFLLKGCAAGRQQACWRAIDILDASPNEVDNREGARVLLERCDHADMVACRRLGRLREEGHGVSKDGTVALTLYKFACDANDAVGCARATRLLLTGSLVKPDSAAGFRYAARACETGEVAQAAEFCAPAGLAYSAGTVVKQDFAHAARLFQRGCDAGDTRACGELAKLSKAGNGAPRIP